MEYTAEDGFLDPFTRLNITTSHKELLWRMPVLLIGVDRKGIIKYVNHLWEKKLGYLPSEMLGRNFMEFVVEDNEEETQDEFKDVNTNQDYDNLFTNHYRCKNGNIVQIEWSSLYIHSTLMNWGLGTVRKIDSNG